MRSSRVPIRGAARGRAVRPHPPGRRPSRGRGRRRRPGAVFFSFLAGWVEMSSAKNAYSDALAAAGVEVPKAGSIVGIRLMDALATVLSRAQDAGAVRKDIGVGELLPVIIGASRAAAHIGGDGELRARAIAIMFDGLRPPGRA